MKDFYITFLDCEHTDNVYTVELAMSDDATPDDAEKYFYSQACDGRTMSDGTEIRALVLSVYDVQTIEDLLLNHQMLPIEIQRYFGDGAFDESEPPPDEDDDGEDWKKLIK